MYEQHSRQAWNGMQDPRELGVQTCVPSLHTRSKQKSNLSCLSERDVFAATLSILINWYPINASVTATMTKEVVKKLPNLASLTTRTTDSYCLCCSFSSSVGSS